MVNPESLRISSFSYSAPTIEEIFAFKKPTPRIIKDNEKKNTSRAKLSLNYFSLYS
jgi:hypothetical protein